MTHQSPAFFGNGVVAVPEVPGSYGKFWAGDPVSAPAPGTWHDLRNGNNMANTGVSLIGPVGSLGPDTYWWFDGSNSWFTTSGTTFYREWGRIGYAGTLEMVGFADPSSVGTISAMWDSLYSGTANPCIQNYHTQNAAAWGITMNAYPAESGNSHNASTGHRFPYSTSGTPRHSHFLYSGAWGQAHNMKVFANGEKVFNAGRSGGFTSGNSTRNPRVGSSEFGGGNARRFIGAIAVVQVWTRALSDAEAMQQFLHWDHIMKIRGNL